MNGKTMGDIPDAFLFRIRRRYLVAGRAALAASLGAALTGVVGLRN